MLRRKQRTRGALFLALLLAPLAAWAVYMLSLVLLDSFHGDGMVLHRYTFESRQELVLQWLSDSRQALPFFYAVALLLWLEIRLLSRLGGWNGMTPAVMAGALTGFALAAIFVDMNPGVLAASIVSGLLLSLMLAWAARTSGSSG